MKTRLLIRHKVSNIEYLSEIHLLKLLVVELMILLLGTLLIFSYYEGDAA